MENVAVIGATGTLGSRVVEVLEGDFEVIGVSHSSGDITVDLEDRDSIQRMFDRLGTVDHLVSAAGVARFGPLEELSDEDFEVSLSNKLMGQVNLIRLGRNHISDGGSVTVTTGVLSQHPIPGSSAISLVNAGLEGFVRAAALELEGTLRVNAVSPGWVSETLDEMGRDPDDGVPARSVAEQGYRGAVEGSMTGEILDVTP